MTPTNAIKIGDRIQFRSLTRSGASNATRLVTGFWFTGEPQVSFRGWGGFVVHWFEISEHFPA